MIISIFLSLVLLAQSANAMDLSSLLGELLGRPGLRVKNLSTQTYSQAELEQTVGVLPDRLDSLASLQTYVAHYLWASNNTLTQNKVRKFLTVDTTKDPCLRLQLHPGQKNTDGARLDELLLTAQQLQLSSNSFQDNVHVVFLNNPINQAHKQKNKTYFAAFLMKNHAHLLPDYQSIMQQLLHTLSTYAETAQIFLDHEKDLSDQEIARLVGVPQVSSQERAQFIKKSQYVFNDINRLLNLITFVNLNISNIQIIEIYFLAEQSFHFLSAFDKILGDILQSGHFFSESDYANNNPPNRQIAQFFRQRQAPMNSLYLMTRAIAFSLRDFADNFRSQVGLPPIPSEIFEQRDDIRAALVIDKTLPHSRELIKEKRAHNKNSKRPILTVDEQEAESRYYLADTLVSNFSKNKKHNKPKKRSLSPKLYPRKISPPRTILSQPLTTTDNHVVLADSASDNAKPSIGARIVSVMTDADIGRLYNLFSRKPDRIGFQDAHVLAMSVYKALVELNKAHRAAEFLKRACDARIFTKGKQERFLSKESIEYHLLPYLLQNIVHPNFDLETMLKESDFLRERVLLEKVMLFGDEIDLEQLSSIEKNLDEGEAFIANALPDKRRVLLVNLAHAWHKLAIATERAKGIEYRETRVNSHNQKIVSLLKKALPYFESSNAAPISVLEAYLLSFYLNIEKSPDYQRLSQNDIADIKQRAVKSMGDPSKKFEKTIHEVSPSGKKLGEFKVDASLYHMVTNDELGDYIVVKFEKPVKDRRIPLFVYYNDTIYRTDVFGGSRLKPNPAEKDYGSLFGIPLRAADFFNQWFTSTSSFWYGQRAFMPAKPDQKSKYAKGDITIQTIPDSDRFAVVDNFIVQDGFGYIKESVANDLNLKRTNRKPDDRDKYVAYQSLHAYDAESRKQAAQELFLGAQKTVLDPNFQRLSAEEKAQVLMSTRPKKTAVGVPVAGDDVILPADLGFEDLAEEGITIGRNPYSAKRCQVVGNERIKFSSRLKDMPVFQYTMTGYIRGQDALNGSFFKGLLAVIPDKYWPEQYRNAQVLVSSKDQKLNQGWRSEDDKNKDQNNGQTLSFTGSILVKEEYNKRSLIGIPVAMAEKLSGDYDGDPYDIMPNKGYQAVTTMIQEEQNSAIPSSKINKPFIAREKVGNFDKILDLRKPISPDWNSINNRFNYLMPEQQQTFCQDMAKSNILTKCLGEDGAKSSCTKVMSDKEIVISEIQLGLKVGEDAYKADCNIKSIMERDQMYQKALSSYNNDPSIPYGNGLVRNLQAGQHIRDAIKPVLNTPKSANVVHKATRAMARFLSDDTTYDGFVSDSDEFERDDE